ncbi:MAG: hypothetical protein A2Z17_04465 [Gammaproteobacteria bacterium RBG_16_66_13]|nr:MAG: hypothetical protein A2Z17_04465 [Gammaproteobacteria bacterium RBG_16_66_13]
MWTWSQTVPSSRQSRILTWVVPPPVAPISVPFTRALVGPGHHSVRMVWENLTAMWPMFRAICRETYVQWAGKGISALSLTFP